MSTKGSRAGHLAQGKTLAETYETSSPNAESLSSASASCATVISDRVGLVSSRIGLTSASIETTANGGGAGAGTTAAGCSEFDGAIGLDTCGVSELHISGDLKE